jgi:hypothetical protein
MRWIFNFATHPSREARSWSSERGGEPNEEALVKLGSEKLARLVIGEAKRNAAFRKLVAAALAASKGPAAVDGAVWLTPGPFGGEGLRLLKHRLHEHLRRPTPSDISKNAPSLQGLSHAGVARSRRHRMISAVNPHQTFNNVTTPCWRMLLKNSC